MLEILFDINILEMVLLVSVFYIAGWSVLDGGITPWSSNQMIHSHYIIDQRRQRDHVPVLSLFLFIFICRKIPALKDHLDDDEYYSFILLL
ncbi:hypothetical protein [Salibacterium aidingense]|uniref:hypothetical protein n=1 Tax=Salibacterium aidingense TaxID=384933 RepID=UPI0003FCEC44|nr:hypothetical protein [Salibacterium aidingense]